MSEASDLRVKAARCLGLDQTRGQGNPVDDLPYTSSVTPALGTPGRGTATRQQEDGSGRGGGRKKRDGAGPQTLGDCRNLPPYLS